jgi:hypothetical protein
MWVNLPAIEVTKGEVTLHRSTNAEGKLRLAKVCGQCGVRLWSEPPKFPGFAVMRPGTLDDKSWVRPSRISGRVARNRGSCSLKELLGTRNRSET